MQPELRYRVGMEGYRAHLFTVELVIAGWTAEHLVLQMPVWTPGSYLVREYSRHLQDFEAHDGEGRPLPWTKTAKHTWQVEAAPTVHVRYRIYAHELTVRTSHLDTSHAYFNGACLFLFPEGAEALASTVTVVPPRPEWRVSTALQPVAGEAFTYRAEHFDALVDSPFEVGTHRIIPFTVLGKSHTLAVWGKSNLDYNRYLSDLEGIILAEAKLFGGLPYEHYLFIVHFADGYGGLEHRDSTTLLYPRFELKPDEKYLKFVCLTAHEFFHLWNVKRIRPSTLDRFDYGSENYTRALWFVEGVTSYYDEIFPLRAGIYGAAQYLKLLGEHITRLQMTPGRLVQSLSEASFDTWIKQYRPGENSPNSQVSYYLKGQLVACLLDLHIRLESGGARSLDDVLRRLWEEYGSHDLAYPEDALETIAAQAAGCPLGAFFDRTLRSTEELEYERYLAAFGLRLVSQHEADAPPYLGVRTQDREGATVIQTVEALSPAQQAGISPGDELIAVGGWKVTHGSLKERLGVFAPGDLVECTLFRRDELVQVMVPLEAPRPSRYRVEIDAEAPAEARARLRTWLGPTVS
jgi:predicted metalloprotease with PDZ domain